MTAYCSVCGAPMHHDLIEGCTFKLGPNHEWMKKAVALGDRSAIHGTVDDSAITSSPGTGKRKTGYVENGLGGGDYVTLHEFCWEFLGKPKARKNVPFAPVRDPAKPDKYGAVWTDSWQEIRPYMGQDFEYEQMRDDGNAWLIEDPSTPAGARNKERISKILAFVPVIINGVDLEKVKKQAQQIEEGAWTSKKAQAVEAKFRESLTDYDKQGYFELFKVRKPYPSEATGLPKLPYKEFLEEFTENLRHWVEFESKAIMTAAIQVQGGCHYLIYSKDPEDTLKTIEKLGELHMPQPSTIERRQDPEWQVVFSELKSLP